MEQDELRRRLSRLLKPVFENYRQRGKTSTLLPVICSFNHATITLRSRGAFVLAEALGLEATLWLASGIVGAATPAHSAAQAAITSAEGSRDVTDIVRDRFVAEQFLNTAVAVKAVGEIQSSIEACAEAAKYLDSVPTSIPLLRQWALMEQDQTLMDRVVDLSFGQRGVSAKERYRSVKRALEFSLNRRDRRSSELLLQQTLAEFTRAGHDLDHISLISLWKNIGQYVALQGDNGRALRILGATHRLAADAGFTGQTRQIEGLVLEIHDGQSPRLETYRLDSGPQTGKK